MKYNGDSFVTIFHEILILHGSDFFLYPAFKYFFIVIMNKFIIEVSFALC